MKQSFGILYLKNSDRPQRIEEIRTLAEEQGREIVIDAPLTEDLVDDLRAALGSGAACLFIEKTPWTPDGCHSYELALALIAKGVDALVFHPDYAGEGPERSGQADSYKRYPHEYPLLRVPHVGTSFPQTFRAAVLERLDCGSRFFLGVAPNYLAHDRRALEAALAAVKVEEQEWTVRVKRAQKRFGS